MMRTIIYNTTFWIAWAGLVLTTWVGDKLVAEFVTGLPTKSSWRATDTIVHGLIGGFSYWLSCIMCPELLLKMSGVRHKFTQFLHGKLSVNLIFSFTVPFILACTVDLDHIMYDGFQLITGGQRVPWKRGWFHYTLPPLILATIFYHSALLFHSPLSLRMATLTISSVISHQVRDGLHHGMWFHPLGHTQRLPYWLYFTLTLSIPFITSSLAVLILMRLNSSKTDSGDIQIV